MEQLNSTKTIIINMHRVLFAIALILLCAFCFATETGQYRYYEFGNDFNIYEPVVDVNGFRDIDFSSDCNISIRQDSTGIFLADNNEMLHDSFFLGLYYLAVDASNTAIWMKGKYTSIINCVDYNNSGTANVSFIIDRDVIQTIIDTNAIGRGLNDDQNQILYDLNTWVVTPAIDTTAPVILVTYPQLNTTTSATLIEFNVTDKSDLNSISVFINNIASSSFNKNTNCSTVLTLTSCSYFETNLTINIFNDINVFAVDDFNNTGTTTSSFLYSSTRPRTSLGGSVPDLSKSFEVDKESIVLEYVKGEKVSSELRVKNNSQYVLFMSFAPSNELRGKVFINDSNRIVHVGEEKTFVVSFINNDGRVLGNLVVSSQYSSVNVGVDLREKPFDFVFLFLFLVCVVGGYLLFVQGG